MINVVDGSAVGRLLEKARRRPADYRRIVIGSPFIDEYGLELLDRLQYETGREGVRIDLVLTPDRAADLAEWVAGWPRLRVTVKDGLHAKVYALLGFRPVASEILVTSANLTSAGTQQNMEMGLNVRGGSDRLASLIEHAAQTVVT